MEMVKYILFCIAGCLDPIVGKSSDLSMNEFFCGEMSILAIIILFYVPFIWLEKKSSNHYKINILLSILITIVSIAIIFLILIVIENCFL